MEIFMSEFDFSTLYDQYPEIIEQMPDEFTAHSFILKLAQANQPQYIEALHAYRNTTFRNKPAPFMVVHNILIKGLSNVPDLVENAGEVNSVDIFGRSNVSSLWRRL
jgi:hypothetical protein